MNTVAWNHPGTNHNHFNAVYLYCMKLHKNLQISSTPACYKINSLKYMFKENTRVHSNSSEGEDVWTKCYSSHFMNFKMTTIQLTIQLTDQEWKDILTNPVTQKSGRIKQMLSFYDRTDCWPCVRHRNIWTPLLTRLSETEYINVLQLT
jgi:hypothetical protein